jgi:hypothetical protein
LHTAGTFFSIELIQKGRGTGPVKPWQPFDVTIGKVLNPVVHSVAERYRGTRMNKKMSRDRDLRFPEHMHLIRLSDGGFSFQGGACPPGENMQDK